MEEMSRYGSPRPAMRRKNSEGKKDKDRDPPPPSAKEVAELRKMILGSCGPDGTPRLDSVSLYSLGKLLGKGAFGAVKLGIHKLSGATVAIKNFKKARRYKWSPLPPPLRHRPSATAPLPRRISRTTWRPKRLSARLRF